MKTNKYVWIVIVLLLFVQAFNTRIISILLLQDYVFPDQHDFLFRADELLKGTYTTTERLPGYPLFIALNYFLYGHSHRALKAMQALIDLLNVVIIAIITFELFGKRASFIAFILASFYPYSIYYSSIISTETLFSFMVSLSIYLLMRYYKKRNLTRLFLCVLAISYAIYVRPTLEVFSFFIFFWIIFISKSQRSKGIIHAFIFAITLGLTFIPFCVKNYLQTGHFVFTTSGGMNFLYGNYIYAAGDTYGVTVMRVILPENVDNIEELDIRYHIPIALRVFEERKINRFDEFEKDRFYYKWGLNSILMNPFCWFCQLFKKFFYLWYPYSPMAKGDSVYSLLYYCAILLSALYGLFKAKIDGNIFSLFVLLFVSISMVSMIFFDEPRYRNPFDPLLMIFAAFCLDKLLFYLRGKISPLPFVAQIRERLASDEQSSKIVS